MSVPPPVTLAELKRHLNLAADDDSNDVELTLHLAAATEALEERVGPMVTREITERVRPGGSLLTLDQGPVVDVTTITSVIAGVPTAIAGLVLDELDIDLDAAVIDLGYRRGAKVYEVTYTAGRGVMADVPDRFKVATLIVAEHLWETQRGSGARPQMFGVVAENNTSSAHAADYIFRGFALPRRALELIASDQTVAFS